MADMNVMIAQTAIRDMLRKGYVSICTVDRVLGLLGITPIGEAYKQLGAIHCIHFSDMQPELVAQIPALLRDVFAGMAVEVLDTPIADTKKRSFFGKLLDA